MPRLLFEIGTEELPAWYVVAGSAALARGLTDRLAALRLSHGEVRTFATPRRLAVLVEDVSDRTEARTESRRGPAEAAAFDAEGRPTRAAVGFAASAGVTVEELQVEVTEKGRYLVARRAIGGEDAKEVLPAALAGLVVDLPAARKMRWGEVDVPFVRPIAWLTALWDDAELSVSVAGATAGRESRGHRFLHPAPVAIGDAGHYEAALLAADVVADRAARARAVVEAVNAAAAAVGGVASAPDALIEEIVDLVERPFAVLGEIDEAYLELPDEVLTTVMIHHQRFVPVRDAHGALMARFVAVANHRVPDAAVVRGGYERVLDGRLRDARFFWQADRRKSLSQHAWSLSGIAFQKDLGSMADKVDRVCHGANALAVRLGLEPGERAVLDRALPVFRADLATEMVGELPELEGTMARAYALAEGQPREVAVALEDGLMPRGPHDALPASRVGAVLAVADRVDKLLGFFALGKRPSGSADPFALRRDAVAVARVLNAQGWHLPLDEVVASVAAGYADGPVAVGDAVADVTAFVWDRAAALLAEEGVAIRTVRAAIAGRRSVVAASRRAHLLHALSDQPAFAEMLALYKRAANLAERATAGVEPDPHLFEAAPEAPLLAAIPEARRGVARLLEAMDAGLPAWDLGGGPTGTIGGLDELAQGVLTLKAPLDAFLDGVMVMVDDAAVRGNRLALLAAVAATPRALGALEHLAL